MFWGRLDVPLARVVANVTNQVNDYDWPGSTETMDPYTRIMLKWAARSRHLRARRQAWGRPSNNAGPVEFRWGWWRLASHTQPMFRPTGCEAAFELNFFAGMLGVSEARAESVASCFEKMWQRSPA